MEPVSPALAGRFLTLDHQEVPSELFCSRPGCISQSGAKPSQKHIGHQLLIQRLSDLRTLLLASPQYTIKANSLYFFALPERFTDGCGAHKEYALLANRVFRRLISELQAPS